MQSCVQGSEGAGALGQNRLPLPLSKGLLTQSSASLDPVFNGSSLWHARQGASQAGLLTQLQSPLGLASSQTAAAPNIWQQHSARQGTMSPSLPGASSQAGSAVGNYLAQQQGSRGWSGPAQPMQQRSGHPGENGSLNDSLERRHSGNGLDLLQSAQGMVAPTLPDLQYAGHGRWAVITCVRGLMPARWGVVCRTASNFWQVCCRAPEQV